MRSQPATLAATSKTAEKKFEDPSFNTLQEKPLHS